MHDCHSFSERASTCFSVCKNGRNYDVSHMILVPALIVAVLFGAVGALLSLIAGYGIRTALVAYWLSANLGLLAIVMPRLLVHQIPSHGSRRRRLAYRALWAFAWMCFGLAIIFWHEFHAHAEAAQAPAQARCDIGSLMGLHATGGGMGRHYFLGLHLPAVLDSVLDWLLRLPLWLPGVIAYFYGLTRFLLTAADRLSVPEKG